MTKGLSHTQSLIVQKIFHNITTMALDLRNTKYTRSIFYRGISLKDYLRKSSVAHKDLEYPDDETILLDQNKTPVIIDDSFIITEPSYLQHQARFRETHCATETRLPSQKSNIQLPTLKSKPKFKIHTHNSYITDRTSTDTSYGSTFDLKISLLPDLPKKQPSHQESNLFSSRSQSKSVSRRKKVTEAIPDLEQVEEEVVIQREKPHITREYTEFIKKEMMLKNRYNIQTKAGNSKGRYYNRVKSFAE